MRWIRRVSFSRDKTDTGTDSCRSFDTYVPEVLKEDVRDAIPAAHDLPIVGKWLEVPFHSTVSAKNKLQNK